MGTVTTAPDSVILTSVCLCHAHNSRLWTVKSVLEVVQAMPCMQVEDAKVHMLLCQAFGQRLFNPLRTH